MQSVMTHSFSKTPKVDIPRSRFDRSHGHKFVMDAGYLYPFYWDDVLPGDTFNLKTACFARLATPLYPIMDNMYLDTHFFFVPYRLIWDNARKFFGEQVDPADSIDYTIPKLEGVVTSTVDWSYTTPAAKTGVLMNILGCPYNVNPDNVDMSALPFRAYNLIFNEWFRDQNLIDSRTVNTDDGPDDADTETFGLYAIQKRGKRHDYFTSALPWPNKKDPTYTSGVTIPFESLSAPVTTSLGLGANPTVYSTSTTNYNQLDSGAATVDISASTGTSSDNLYADLTNVQSTINELREAFQIQRLLEKDARGGTRYSEIVRNHFGVDFYDVSYRPEYLGGGSAPINISPIAQQGVTTSGTQTGVGDLAAMGTVGFNDHGFSKSFVEHGLVMGIMSVRADLTYQQGLRRELSKSTRYDVYWPSLAYLGEQAILNKEIYCQNGIAADDEVFGYQERYAEYRYKPSQISGDFHSSAATSLDPWHLSQEFSSLPTLGQTFIEESPPIDRCIQVSTEPHFIVDTFTTLYCARPMPVYSVPGMVDHF
jgi:hypothetical protein